MAFILSKCENSGVLIIDTSEYLHQSEFPVLGNALYTYAESYTVNILYKVDLNKNTTLVDYTIAKHGFDENNIPSPDESILWFELDGLHQITLLILPNKEWVETYKVYLEDLFDNTYYCDGEAIYNLYDNEVYVEDLILECSNILYKSKYTFVLDNVLQRFKEESLKVLLNNSKPLIRNVLWIGIDVIKYCLSQGWYFEAERRLQLLINCINRGVNGIQDGNNSCCCLKTQWMNLYKLRKTTYRKRPIPSASPSQQKTNTNFKGTVNNPTEISSLVYYRRGWYWVVGTVGIYVGQHCEVGDVIHCISDFDGVYRITDFNVIQANLTPIQNSVIDELFNDL